MILAILVQLLYSLPLIIVWLVGVILAIVSWQRHPHLSMLVVITFLLFIFVEIINDIVNVSLPAFIDNFHISIETFEIIRGVLNLIVSIPLWTLLIWAIFGWRKSALPAPVLQVPQPYPLPPYQQWQSPYPSPQPQPQQPQSPLPDSTPPQGQA